MRRRLPGIEPSPISDARTPVRRPASIWPYVLIGLFLLLFLSSAVEGPDLPSYLEWAQAFRHLDTNAFLSSAHILSPMGIPLTQWSHGLGLIFSLCPAVCGPLAPSDTQVLLIGWGFALVFWWALFRLLRQAAYGDVQWAIYGVLIAICGTHLGFYSRSYASETLSQTFLALMALWVLTRKTWRGLDALVVGCLAGFLVIIRWQLLIYALPLFGVMYYGVWRARGRRKPWVTASLVVVPWIPVLAGLAQVALTNRWMTGDLLRSPYSFGAGAFRSLDFARPELLAVLLHPWHGLLSHHPLYLLGFIALILLTFQSRSKAERLFYGGYILVILAHVYLQAAWYVWWLGSSTFGMRGLSISAVVLVPVIVRFMREREIRSKSNRLFGALVLAACLWSIPLFRISLSGVTEYLTYSKMLRSYGKLTRALLPALLVFGLTLAAVLVSMRRTTNKSLVRLREALRSQLHRRLILSISLLILVPIGLYCLVAYTLTRYAERVGANAGLSDYLALAAIPLGVILVLLFLSTSDPPQVSAGPLSQGAVNGRRDPLTNRSKMLAFESVAAWLLIGLYLLANAVFIRFAVHVEAVIAAHPAPTDQIDYVSPVRVDEVEESYCEYLLVPGFEAKKEALRGFLERLKTCAATGPAAAELPQCANPPEVEHRLDAIFAPFVEIDRVALAGAMTADDEATFHAGDLVGLTTYWTPLEDARPLKFSQRLQDSSGRQWLQVDYWPQSSWVACRSSDSWRRGETHADRRGIRLPPDLPPGRYELSLVVYDPETGAAVPAGERPSVQLAGINVVAAAPPPDTTLSSAD